MYHPNTSRKNKPRNATFLGLFFTFTLLLATSCAPTQSAARDNSWQVDESTQAFPWSSSALTPSIKAPSSKHTWGLPEHDTNASKKRAKSLQANMVEFAFQIYRDHITKVDGPRCEHRPTCSRYAIESVRKHGFVIGSWLTVDRLIRTSRSSSLRGLPVIRHPEGHLFFEDPVEENDFFF